MPSAFLLNHPMLQIYDGSQGNEANRNAVLHDVESDVVDRFKMAIPNPSAQLPWAVPVLSIGSQRGVRDHGPSAQHLP